MSTQPPENNSDKDKGRPDGTKKHLERNTDEIAVTEVPDDVVREMEELFGVAPEALDPTVISLGDISVQEDVTVREEATVREEVVLRDDVSRDGASHEVDSSVAVIEIGADVDDVMVINADDIDRVVIVDQDQPDPTFEERRRKRERREKLKKIRWFKWLASFVGFAVVVIGVLASPVFSVDDIEVEGVVYTSSEAIAAATDLLRGDSFFTLDTSGAIAILKNDPWVSDVRISKHFPDSVVIEIAERVPVVWYVGEDNLARVVDAEGRIIAVLEGWPTDYLQVTGVGPSLQAGAVADVGYRAAAQTVLALPDELSRLVESMGLSPGGELSMNLTSGTVVRFGTPTDLQNKLVSVVVLLRRQNPTDIAVIDVSTGEVTVAMR
jgi:cell division protein FtsQ